MNIFQKTRSLNYFENLAYRINSGVLKMGKGKRLSTEEKSKLEGAKKQFRFEAKKDLHLQLDQPDPCGSGGSSDTAAVARTFFSFKKRQDVLKLFHGNSEQNSAIDTLLRNFSRAGVAEKRSRTSTSIDFRPGV